MIDWNDGQLYTYLMSIGVAQTTAAMIQDMVARLTSDEAHGGDSDNVPFPDTALDASLVEMMQSVIPDIIQIATGVYIAYGLDNIDWSNVEAWIRANRPDIASFYNYRHALCYIVAEDLAQLFTYSSETDVPTVDNMIGADTFKAMVFNTLTMTVRYLRQFALNIVADTDACSASYGGPQVGPLPEVIY
jgi:hypothetical protein